MPPIDIDASATILKVVAMPVEKSASNYIRINETSSNETQLHSLKPFTLYKFIVKVKATESVIAEIGPNRTWPSGNSLLI